MDPSASLQTQVEEEDGGGPIKRDVLLTNMQLVDVETPIIWHGLHRTSDGILRQALMSPEKEVKAEEKALLSETLFASSGVIMLGDTPIIALDDNPPQISDNAQGVEGKTCRSGSPKEDRRLLERHFETPKKKRVKRKSTIGDKNRLAAEVDLPMFAASHLGTPHTTATFVAPQGIHILPDITAVPAKVRTHKCDGNDARGEFDANRPPSPPSQSPEILNHDPGSGSEYTDHLLSQISGVLPAMSSSQVSSVLSALEPSLNEGRGGKDTNGGNLIKIEEPGSSLTPPPSSTRKLGKRKLKQTASFSKPTAIEVSAGKASWFKCSSCLYIALERASIERHLAQVHASQDGAKTTARPKLKCLACSNIFHSLQSLKVHLLLDHEVDSGEVSGLLEACLEANKTWKSDVKSKTDKEIESARPGKTTSESLVVLPTVPEFSLFETVDKYLGGCKGETESKEEKKEVAEVGGGGGGPADKKEPPSLVAEDKPHQIKIEKDIGLKCDVEGCTVRLMYPANMDYHKKCHKDGAEWVCPECGVGSPSWANLRLHLWRTHGLDIELYSCDQCSYKTNSLSKLMNLHRRIHGEERPFLCDLCGKGFKTTKQLRNHKGIHRSKTAGRELVCSTCGRTFSEVRMLRHHEDIVHRKLRPYLCSVCGHAAASRSTLRMHHRLHSGEKPYRCSECDYTTSDHNSLRRHKMRHSGAKHYSCPHCPYASIQSSTYKSHLKNKHPGLDEGFMFSCQYCPFRTVKKDNFLSHAASHALTQMGDNMISTESS